jgi:hypothetical protein
MDLGMTAATAQPRPCFIVAVQDCNLHVLFFLEVFGQKQHIYSASGIVFKPFGDGCGMVHIIFQNQIVLF